MIGHIYHDLADARSDIQAMSAEEPGYFYLVSCFGLMIHKENRLGVFAPSDAYGDTYWLNGKEKPFTSAQKIADQNATPTLN